MSNIGEGSKTAAAIIAQRDGSKGAMPAAAGSSTPSADAAGAPVSRRQQQQGDYLTHLQRGRFQQQAQQAQMQGICL